MSRLFRGGSAGTTPQSNHHHHHHSRPQSQYDSAYSSLLEPRTHIVHPHGNRSDEICNASSQPYRRIKSTPSAVPILSWATHSFSSHMLASQPWLSALNEGGGLSGRSSTSWGLPPPTRNKLVKEPGNYGSGRPSFSVELADGPGDGTKEKGVVRRQFARLKGMWS